MRRRSLFALALSLTGLVVVMVLAHVHASLLATRVLLLD